MSGQEAYEVLPDEDQEQPEPVRLRLVKTAAEAPAPAGRQGLELRSYLPTPRNLRVLLAGVGEGTCVLVGRGWDWLRGEAWDSDSAMKAGGVLFVCYAAGTAALEQWGTYTGYLIPPAVAVWCLIARQHTTLAVAVRTAVKEAKEAEGERLLAEERRKIAAAAKEAVQRRVGGAAELVPADTADTAVDTADTVEESAVPADDDGVELTADEAAGIIRRVAARHPRHLGVHLSDLLAEPELEGWEQTELKATLTELGLPVTSFKLTFPVGPARTRDGVRLEHLPPVPEAPVGEAGGRASGEAPQGSPAPPPRPRPGPARAPPPAPRPGWSEGRRSAPPRPRPRPPPRGPGSR